MYILSSKRGRGVLSSPIVSDLSGGRRASLRHSCPATKLGEEEAAEGADIEEEEGRGRVGLTVEGERNVGQHRLNWKWLPPSGGERRPCV